MTTATATGAGAATSAATTTGAVTLYDIAREFRELEQYLLEIGGDVTDAESESQVIDQFTRIEMSRDAKLEGYAMILRTLALRAQVRKEEAKRLNALAKADETAEQRLKAHLLTIFEIFGWTGEIQTTRFKFKAVQNAGNLPIELNPEFEENPELLPEAYRKEKVTYTADTDAIRAALQAGEELSFAKFGERGSRISIK